MRLRLSLVLALVIALSALPAVSVGGTVRIRATSQRTWNPAFKAVPKGTKIVWKNPTGIRHTVTAYGGNWSKNAVIRPGERTSKTFRRRGAFRYRCTLHSVVSSGTCSGMCGHIHVN